MRKVLSIVLALAMVLGCFSFVFAAEFSDVKADAKYASAVGVLSDLKVVSGYTDGSYKPDKAVSRAEMASLIINALSMTPSKTATTNFSDVPSSHWASGYIAYASSLGIIGGYTDGTFKPDQTVSYDEAITMLVNALGYNKDSLAGTTYPTAYIMKAQSLGITKDVELLGTAGAARGDVAILLYNTLGQSLGKTNKDGEFVADTYKDGANTLEDNMFHRLGANVEATPFFIDDKTPTAIDLSEYLGTNASVITNAKGEVIAVSGVAESFVEGKLVAGKIGTTAYTGTPVVFRNGVKVEETIDETITYKFAVDSKKNLVSAQYWKADKEDQVAADVKADAVELLGVKLPLNEDGKTVKTSAFELVGADSIGAIKKNSIVSIYLANGNVVKVEVGTDTVVGKITKVSGGKAYINGTGYAYDTANYDFENDYIAYFNYAGVQFKTLVLAPAEEVKATTLYAVVVDAAYSTSSTSAEWASDETTSSTTKQVKLLLADGTTAIYTVSAKAKGDDKLGYKGVEGAKALVGLLVKYTLNDADELLTMAEYVPATAGKALAVEKNGTLDAKEFAANAVVFLKTVSKDKAGKDVVSYSVVKAADLAGKTLAEAPKYDLKNGQISLIFTQVAGTVAEKTYVYGVYTGEAQLAKNYEVYFLVDGSAATYTATESAKLTVNGAVLKIELNDTAYVTVDDTFSGKAIDVATKAAISGNTFLADGATEGVLVDAKAVVYTFDTKTKTVAKAENRDEALTLDKAAKVTLYKVDDKDDYFDIVVIAK